MPVFTSEADAFAAAERTYRGYVEALNRVDLSDPRTFEDVYAWTTGELNASDRKVLSQMHADRWTMAGKSVPTLVQPGSTLDGFQSVTLEICVAVKEIELRDPSGTSMVSPRRGDYHSLIGSLTRSDQTSTGWVLTMLEAREGDPLCE